MDVFSHGVWALAIARGADIKTNTRVMRPAVAFFFGIFPDLFAFSIPILSVVWAMLSGDGPDMAAAPGPGPSSLRSPEMLTLAHGLYNLSHSLIVFLLVFIVVALLRKKRPYWELSGWLFHILCDIPTHSGEFFPTPIFWPLADWKFDGFSWGQPWFIIANWTTLILVHLGLTLWKRSKQKADSSYAPPQATS